MQLIDFHCDTPTEMWKRKTDLSENGLMVDLKAASAFRSYTQLAAIFTPPTVPDSGGIGYVKAVLDYLVNAARRCDAQIITNRQSFQSAAYHHFPAFLPTIEDARILDGDIYRADTLFDMGIRLATLTWKDTSIIGGAWNTDAGLTPFGHEAVVRFLKLGIIPDVSHASPATVRDVASLCRVAAKPFVATHSNAFALMPHRRNLEDEQIRAIALSGGVIGVNLYPPFLTRQSRATLDDVSAHIRHLMNVGGEGSIVLGTDLDGVDALPDGIDSLSTLPRIAHTMSKSGFTQAQIDRLFFQNGSLFLIENLP
ncbi:MAG: membrane dipeptidase [Clostridia bacterium]|nr:membrane dipeptidase [Clostridia bacterium]